MYPPLIQYIRTYTICTLYNRLARRYNMVRADDDDDDDCYESTLTSISDRQAT